MTRRFRRRPSLAIFLFLGLLLLVLARVAYDRARDRRAFHAAPLLREGQCEVLRVIAGDSILVRQTVEDPADSKRTTTEATIRLLGIDCPDEDEPLSTEATAMTRRLVDNRTVTLRFDRRRLDQYERFLAYVFVDDQLVNTALVEAGLARAAAYPGDSQSMSRAINQAEAAARSERRGIWER